MTFLVYTTVFLFCLFLNNRIGDFIYFNFFPSLFLVSSLGFKKLKKSQQPGSPRFLTEMQTETQEVVATPTTQPFCCHFLSDDNTPTS